MEKPKRVEIRVILPFDGTMLKLELCGDVTVDELKQGLLKGSLISGNAEQYSVILKGGAVLKESTQLNSSEFQSAIFRIVPNTDAG